MIEVTLFVQDNDIVGYELAGHALARGKGQRYDLVCAGVSAIAIATANGICEVVGIKPQIFEVDDGYMKLILPKQLSNEHALQAQTLLKTFALGIESMVDDFSKHIKVFKRRWTS